MAGRSDASFLRRTTKNSLAGTGAGIAGCLVGHPFDTLKVRLQTQPVHNPVYKGLTDCFVKTIKWEGLGGLYKGVGSPLVGQMFFRAVLFTSYYQFTNYLAGPERVGKRLTHPEYYIAGGLTGFVAAFVESPIDLFKTKMQIQIIRSKSGGVIQYRNVFHAGWIISRTYGVRGVYQGLSATCLRNTPACAVYFGFYELLKDTLAPAGTNNPPVWVVFVSAGTAGFLYWFLTYPTDVIKSTMQSDESDKGQRKFKSIVDCAKKLYLTEGGWTRFFRGFSPCLLRAVPANATMWFVVERIRTFLDRYM